METVPYTYRRRSRNRAQCDSKSINIVVSQGIAAAVPGLPPITAWKRTPLRWEENWAMSVIQGILRHSCGKRQNLGRGEKLLACFTARGVCEVKIQRHNAIRIGK